MKENQVRRYALPEKKIKLEYTKLRLSRRYRIHLGRVRDKLRPFYVDLRNQPLL